MQQKLTLGRSRIFQNRIQIYKSPLRLGTYRASHSRGLLMSPALHFPEDANISMFCINQYLILAAQTVEKTGCIFKVVSDGEARFIFIFCVLKNIAWSSLDGNDMICKYSHHLYYNLLLYEVRIIYKTQQYWKNTQKTPKQFLEILKLECHKLK